MYNYLEKLAIDGVRCILCGSITMGGENMGGEDMGGEDIGGGDSQANGPREHKSIDGNNVCASPPPVIAT
jgi:hypothetical protein